MPLPTEEQVREQLAAGQIGDEWYVWRDGLAEWQTIAATPELLEVSPPPAATPPLADADSNMAPLPVASTTSAVSSESPAAGQPQRATTTPASTSTGDDLGLIGPIGYDIQPVDSP